MTSFSNILRIAFLLLLTASCSALSQRHTCARCGCQTVQKRCQVTCETKQVPKAIYSTEQEEICMPEHRCCAGVQPVENCADTDGSCATCGKIYTRTKLVKKSVDVPVKKYQWKVVTECPHCDAQQPGCAQLEPAAPADAQ